MKRILLISWMWFCFPHAILSQEGNLKSCLSKTRLFVNLYNNHQFKQIYQQFDSAYQTSHSEADLLSFLEISLYQPYGKIMGFEHLSQSKNYQTFFLLFTQTRMKLNIALNPRDQITSLEFLPYEDAVIRNTDSLAFDNALNSGLDSLVHKLVNDYLRSDQTCGLSIGIWSKGKSSYYNYGETARGSRRLPSKESIYEAGAITKTFTGMLLAKAILDKKINPENDVRDYLEGKFPNLEYQNKGITLLQLANHSSGLPRNPSNLTEHGQFDSLNPYRNYTQKMLLEELHTLSLQTLPGTHYEYSNLGVAVLGMILEKTYKTSYPELIKHEVLDVLNMQNSGIELNEAQNLRYLQGYSVSGDTTKHWDLGIFAPAGGLKTSTEDLLKYLSYQVAETDTLTKLTHRVTFENKEKLAISWFIRSGKFRGDLFWHNGATFGFSSFCGFIRESQTALVILANNPSTTDYIAIQIFKYLSNR